MRFGWLKDTNSYNTSNISISAVASYAEAIAEVEKSPNQDGKWFYPPIICKSNQSGPRVPDSRFELPVTHEIEHKFTEQNQELLEFIVMFFGWLHGQRLMPEGYGHLTKTTIAPILLVDFVPNKKMIPRLLSIAEDFWHENQKTENLNTMTSAIHWYLVSQSYERYFERFMAQYMVMDTLYNLVTKLKSISEKSIHAKRIQFLSGQMNIPCPSWGVAVKIHKFLRSEITFFTRASLPANL